MATRTRTTPAHEIIATLGERLRAMRLAANKSQQQLADALHVTKSHISSVETGRSGISIELTDAWAETCGYELRDVFLPDGELGRSLLVLSGISPEHAVVVVELAEILPHLEGWDIELIVEYLKVWKRKLGLSSD